ncbi:MAG: VWA domain-containing protein [Gloeotrichia echinulata CP02]|jgi:Ca-activated chloride channel family protein
MKKGQIKLDILTERPIVRNDAISELDLVIEVNSQQLTNELDRKKALNLCIVIDRSGSMSGEKLETAKKSCIDIYKQLDEKDLFTVVVFDDDAEVVVNPQVPKSEVIEKINKINTAGSTNLSLGWYLGLLELQTYMTENHNNRLFLLSDGQANQGETKVTILAQEASKSRELGITTSTIGIGDDFQEDILAAIATESGGRFWYIQESRIEYIINEEFKGAMSVIIDRPRIQLNLPKGVAISKKLNDLTKIGDNKYRVNRPIKGKDQFNFAVRVEVNPENTETNDLNLEAILFDGEESVVRTQTVVLIKSYQEYVSSKINPIVQSVVQQFQAILTNETLLEKMPESGLELMRKMLVEDVKGMRKVRDALEEQRKNERVMQEIIDNQRRLFGKENALLITEILENFRENQEFREFQEFQYFITRLRKFISSENQKGKMRLDNQVNFSDIDKFDEDFQVSILEEFIELADTLIQRFPDKANELLNYQRKIRENLARYQ